MCLDHPIIVEVTKIGHQNTLNLVVELMNKAESSKPKIARIADSIASRFVAAVLITAGTVWASWMFIDPDKAFWIALSVLVVTCPCALSLATPTAITAATSALKRSGLVITSTHVLETLPTTTDVLFDKTGTLTQGKLTLAEVKPCDGFTEEQVLELAAQIEGVSEHPIARAFPKSANHATEVEITPGGGISGVIGNELYHIGHTKFISKQINASIQSPPDQDHWIILANNQKPIAWFKIEDTERNDAEQTISELREKGLNVHMLTGDHSQAAQIIGNKLRIPNIHSGLSPQEKLDQLNKLHKENKQTLLGGDGSNDIPVLASAGVSIAMSDATD